MKHHEATQLNFQKAIDTYGHARSTVKPGDHVILVEATARLLATSDEPVEPRRSVIIAEVTEVIDDGRNAKISKVYRYYEDDSRTPEEGEAVVSLEHLSKTAMERIQEGDDVYDSL